MTSIRSILLLLFPAVASAQTNPIINGWLINTNGAQGSHYVSGNSTAIQDPDSANVKTVYYSATWAYIRANGVPSYTTGPFLDGNPSFTTSQNAIFKLPLNPVPNTGTPTATSGGNIGLFINGVALFDFRDGVAWNSGTNSLCGGPGNPPCPGGPGTTMDWNRDATDSIVPKVTLPWAITITTRTPVPSIWTSLSFRTSATYMMQTGFMRLTVPCIPP
jgi:hypothetical protein